MDKGIQNIISGHIINDLIEYKVSKIDAIGLLESIKLALFNEDMEKMEK